MPKRNAIVILNPTAGRAKSYDLTKILNDKLKSAGWEFELTTPESQADARSIVKSSSENGFDTVVAAGGDGTVHDVLEGINLENQSMGIIPTGSGNDIYRMLKIKPDPVVAIDNLVNGEDWKIDIGDVNGTRFLNTAGIGIDSETLIVRRETSGWVKRNYVMLFLKTMGGLEPAHIKITADGEIIEDDFMWVIACNNNYIGGGMLIGPKAKLDDGLLDLILIRKMTKFNMVCAIPSIFKGTFINRREVTEMKVSEILLETESPRELGVDGELIATTPAKITVRLGALSLIAPKR